MRQAIIWTNDGYFTDAYMRHSASWVNIDNIFLGKSWVSVPQEPI